MQLIHVALDVPLDRLFTYQTDLFVEVGMRVLVPFHRRLMVGVVVQTNLPAEGGDFELKSVAQVLDKEPLLSKADFDLAQFVAYYYCVPLGEVLLSSLPNLLRSASQYLDKTCDQYPLSRIKKRKPRQQKGFDGEGVVNEIPALNEMQSEIVDRVTSCEGFQSYLLYGVTGSGKTLVYLNIAKAILSKGQQVLFMVPEINLTDQFESRVRQFFSDEISDDEMVVLHSEMTPMQRLRAWYSAHQGKARLILGTRLSIFTPIPKLGLVVVDEEHDVSYKQQEGMRYHARDLAVWRAKYLNIPIVLGSATPSMESWRRTEEKRTQLLSLPERATQMALPEVHMVSYQETPAEPISPEILKAMKETLVIGQQVLVLLNRRGFSPILYCPNCRWTSQCAQCSVHTVLHKEYGKPVLLCHHCGVGWEVVHACPECGEQDVQPLGFGTQRIETYLAQKFSEYRLARLDTDSAKTKKVVQTILHDFHHKKYDILLGTQMISKGHDFKHVGLVVVLNADHMLLSPNFRSSEHLFAQLMQVSGRAGRHQANGRVMIQTVFPDHSLYKALKAHDYQAFCDQILNERYEVELPPFSSQAMLSVQSKHMSDGIGFLQSLKQALADVSEGVRVHEPVPSPIVRVKNVEHTQMLFEASDRQALRLFLRYVQGYLETQKTSVKWMLEVDPM